jgi:hypothetical protein
MRRIASIWRYKRRQLVDGGGDGLLGLDPRRIG